MGSESHPRSAELNYLTVDNYLLHSLMSKQRNNQGKEFCLSSMYCKNSRMEEDGLSLHTYAYQKAYVDTGCKSAHSDRIADRSKQYSQRSHLIYLPHWQYPSKAKTMSATLSDDPSPGYREIPNFRSIIFPVESYRRLENAVVP